MLGLAIGDAIGVPVEFKSRIELKRKPVVDMQSGVWNQPAGTWSDDTSMTLATIDALNKHNWEVDDSTLYDIMENFRRWYIQGDFAACGIRFDVGNTCAKAIRDLNSHIMLGNDNFNCFGVGNKSYGNGSLMRILPCMFLDLEDTTKISRLIHYDKQNDLCGECCEFYVRLLKNLVECNNKFKAFHITFEDTFSKFSKQQSNLVKTSKLFRCGDEKEFINLDEDYINSS